MASYTAAERKRLEAAVREDARLECPSCGGEVTRRDVQRPPEVSYVRRRVWLLCVECGRTGAVDVSADGRS